MPQIPLLVSSGQSGTEQKGAFDVRFQPPLHIPEEAKNATIHLAHATIPFTEPNVSAALKNNTIVVALPTADGSGSVPEFTSAAQQKYVVVIPDGLYDVAGLERAINIAVNGVPDPRARGHYYKRPSGSDFSEIADDGTTGTAIARDDVPNWCQLIPDFETNRLHLRLIYPGSAIFFSDARCTLGSVLGFTSDVNTEREVFQELKTVGIGLDVLWRESLTDDSGNPVALQQFSITVPALAVGYTAAALRTKINQLVGDYLYTNHSIGPATSPFNAMIASLTVEANPTAPKSFFSTLAYTNANLVRLRGRADFSSAGSLNTSTLPRGQLRAGLPATSSIYNNVFGGWSSIGNPYDLEAGYLMALGHPVNTAADGTGSTIGVTAAERHTVALLIAMGAHYPGQRVESKSPDPIHNVETWELATARVSAEGASGAQFNTDVQL